MRLLLSSVLALTLAACGPSAETPDADVTPVDAQPAPMTVVDSTSGDTLLIGAAQVSDEQVTVTGLTQGDRACYMDVRGPGGARTETADFEFCERDDLIGQTVTLTFIPTQIQASSCNGDPDCRDTEEVRMVIAADLVIAGDPAP